MTIFYTVLGDVTYHTTEHDHISRYRAPLPLRMATWPCPGHGEAHPGSPFSILVRTRPYLQTR